MARRNEKPADCPAAEVDRDEVAYWQRLVAEQVASGLGQDEFCEQRRVSPGRFRYWKYTKLGLVEGRSMEEDASQVPAAASLVPVRVVQGPRPELWRAAQEEVGPSGVEVMLPCGLRICLQRGFDGSVLREVVEMLGC